MAVDASIYAAIKKDLLELIRTSKCNPLLIRLAWHDSGTFDKVFKCSRLASMLCTVLDSLLLHSTAV